LRLLFGFMFAHPGKKLMFMGMEFGQYAEWNYKQSLDWHLLQYDYHRNTQKFIADLNRLYRSQKALYERDFDQGGFEWIDSSDSSQSVISFLRRAESGEALLIACNFTPVPRYDYRLGVPISGEWTEIFNSDASDYGGSGVGNMGRVFADNYGAHGREFSLSIALAPLSVMIFKNKRQQ
jgi:1,4-alpha-glucan branching enzyme